MPPRKHIANPEPNGKPQRQPHDLMSPLEVRRMRRRRQTLAGIERPDLGNPARYPPPGRQANYLFQICRRQAMGRVGARLFRRYAIPQIATRSVALEASGGSADRSQ